MRRSPPIKPISYVTANAAEILLQLAERREPLLISFKGEVKAVLQDLGTWQRNQEALALLEVLALGTRQAEEGRVESVTEVADRLRRQGREPRSAPLSEAPEAGRCGAKARLR